MAMQPETKYAKSGDVNIAYQVVGHGPLDLVWVPGWVSHVEYTWGIPGVPRFINRLASFSRLIMFDKRGTGLSDPVALPPTLEQRMDDVRAVMDVVRSERAALFGVSEGGPMSLLFAATYPQRTSALCLYGTAAKTPEHIGGWLDEISEHWGEGALLQWFLPSFADDEVVKQRWARYQRTGASPGMARALIESMLRLDIRDILPTIRVPTLILHRRDELVAPVEGARYMAQRIPGAKYVELPGIDHVPFAGDADAILDEIQEFLTGVRPGPEPDRVLATVLFTDIVGSTQRAADMGDRRWHNLLDSYYSLARRELVRFRGCEVKTMGDGFLATFDGPARAIRCACAVSDEVGQLGIAIRAGLHTGECEMMGEDVVGIAVHIGARVAAEAGPGEVLVSSTVKDLVAGSGIEFEDRGNRRLKGVPDEWRLFAVRRDGDRIQIL